MCRNIKTFFNTAGYLKDGRTTSKEDIVVGIDTFPETLLKLFAV